MFDLIEAPSNLGLRPPPRGGEPGTWRAPAVLVDAGLARRVGPASHVRLPRPAYSPDAQPDTRLLNGPTVRAFDLALSAEVEASLRRGAVPLVVGGDCSILLGCLHALRRTGGRGLVHVDGHSDFTHPGNTDLSARLGTPAGMDLALATGRGEALLTRWPGVEGPLVEDADVVQVGEREEGRPDFYADLAATAIARLTVQWVREAGVAAAVARTLGHLEARAVTRAWLHVDLDVLDADVLPAVDDPGSPGLTSAQLAQLLHALLGSGRFAGLDVAIFDPDLDPDGRHARGIVACLGDALGGAGGRP